MDKSEWESLKKGDKIKIMRTDVLHELICKVDHLDAWVIMNENKVELAMGCNIHMWEKDKWLRLECKKCGTEVFRDYVVRDGYIYCSNVKKLEAALLKADEGLSGVDGAYRYYDDHYKGAKRDTSDDGRPTDPEWHVYKSLERAVETRAEISEVVKGCGE